MNSVSRLPSYGILVLPSPRQSTVALDCSGLTSQSMTHAGTETVDLD